LKIAGQEPEEAPYIALENEKRYSSA